MSDACCGGGESLATSPTRLRDIAAIRAAAVAGVALLVGLIAAAADATGLATAALLVASWSEGRPSSLTRREVSSRGASGSGRS